MSDPSDESITHVFDQTNGVIPAADGETDGALSGRTASGVADETGAPGATDAVPPRGRADDGAGRADTSDASDPASSSSAGGTASAPVDVQSATIDVDRSDRAGEDFAPTADLPLPGSGRSDSSGDEEHVFAVDSAGDATETDDVTGADDAAYSGAPAVAAWSAADDGRDEGRTRGESSTAPVDEASHTGRLADAYATGPAEQVDDGARGASGSSTAAAYAAGPAAEATGSSTSGAAASGSDAAGADERASDDEASDAADPRADGSVSASATRSTDGLDDDSIGHVFDQTNGVIESIDGESDGTAASDTSSAGDREADR